MNINVLRLDHRIGRDTRITTHVCLTARAFGASKVWLAGEEDHSMMKSVRDIADRWGGDFEIEYNNSYMEVIMNWRENGGKIVHLTMYGSQAHEIVDEVRETGDDILIIVGGAKVPTKVYKNADWNVSVTTQPHSEVAALAIFQHLLMEGKEFDLEFENPVFEVIPTAHGKTVNHPNVSMPSFYHIYLILPDKEHPLQWLLNDHKHPYQQDMENHPFHHD